MKSPVAAGLRQPIDRRSLLLGSIAAGLVPGAALSAPGLLFGRPARPGSGSMGSDVPGKEPLPGAPAPAEPVAAADPRLAEMVARVSQGRLRASVEGLSAFPTRWSESPAFPAVEGWVADAFVDGGADPQSVARQAYTMPSGTPRNNIVCGNPLGGRDVILVGAHMDSISEQPSQLAPGANDNASGVATLLEAQRILSQYSFDKEIVFVAFSGEEQDLLGSAACSDIASREGWPIDLMVNLDMLGFRPANPQAPIIIEYDQGNVVFANDAPARVFGLMAARMAGEHSSLATEHTDIWDSDYMPFEARGFVCIGLYDGGADAPEYHTSADASGLVDFPRLEQVARILVATVATAAGLSA